MAVAPLILLPFAGSRNTATALLWISLFGFIWVLMEPSRRRGEMPHDARARVSRAVLRDPLFWFSLVLVAYTGIRAMNGGIQLSYDAELMAWSIREPAMPFLPGCAEGAGYDAFVMAVSLSVVFQGLRHSLGRSARAAFLLVASILSATAAIALAFAVSYGHPNAVAMTKCTVFSTSYFGTVFGLQLLCALAALVDVVICQWVKAEPLAALALVGNAVGLVMLAPQHTIAVFLVAYLLLVIVSFVIVRKNCPKSVSFRCALAVLMSLGAPVLYMLSTADLPPMAAKLAAIKAYEPFPADFLALRDALSSIAVKTWKENPWLGTGLNTFALDIRFAATAADWQIVSPTQETALCGWWQLLTERGVIGAAVIAVTLGMLLWTYVARMVRSFSDIRFSPEHFVGPICLLALVAVAFVDCSFLRPEVLMLAGVLIAFSGGALPAKSASSGEEREV